MKIDRKKLITLICDKTGMKPESVEGQLNELITQIRQASDRGNALEIKGFGMFYHTSQGELTFDPAEELKTEINYKYVGMESVEVKKPAAAASPFPSSDKGGKKEAKASVDKMEHPLDNEEKNPAATLITSIVVVLVIVIGIILLVDFGYMDGLFSREQVVLSPPETTQSEEAPESIVPDETAPVITEAEEPASPDVQEPADIPVSEEDEVASAESDGSSEGSEESEAPEPETETVETVVEAESSEELASAGPAEGSVTPFGLYGKIQMIDHRFYTIVVHSMQSESRAREAAGELSEEGYRAIAITVLHDDIGQMWRVGIGQFATIPLAQRAASDLPEEFRENNFIGLIQ
ncbi:MAG: SPOR domain-containing protein [Balneolaceae bacterium]